MANHFENKILKLDMLRIDLDQLPALKPKELEQLKNFFRVGVTYSSNALEGNTLSEIETKVIIEDGLTVSGKPLREIYEATGHADAFDFMMTLVKGEIFTVNDVKKMHQLFYQKIDRAEAGNYRKTKVFISGANLVLPNPEDVIELMEKFIQELPLLKKNHHPVELAAIVHNNFVTIHPFTDGNGRTARLLMNLILIQAGYPVTVIPPINRVAYFETTRRGNDGEHGPFINFLSCMCYESMKDLIRMLR